MEKGFGLVDPPQQDQIVHVPEAAGEEGSLPFRQAILRLLAAIAQHQPVHEQPALDRRDRSAHPLIARGQEADYGDAQQARVEGLRTIGLDEASELGIVAFIADLGMDAVADGAPFVIRTVEFVRFAPLDGAIEGDPSHDLRMYEMLARSSDLPDALIRLGPNLGEVIEKDAPMSPTVLGW